MGVIQKRDVPVPSSHSDRRDRGFSLIEMVVVIVLMGIMGVVVASRFSQPASFSPLIARDAVLATAREAQQHALGREDVRFRIGQAGNNWVFTVVADGGALELRSLSIPSTNVVLETGSTAASGDTCATGFDVAIAGDFEVQFDGRGNASAYTNASSTTSVDNGIRICINDDVALSLCISPAGFAHEGACED